MKQASGTYLAIAMAIAATAFPVRGYTGSLPVAIDAMDGNGTIYIDRPKLEELAKNPKFKLIDIRAREYYVAGHIKGAINLPASRLDGRIGNLYSELLPSPEREAAFRDAGLSYDDTIVLYGDVWVGKSYIAFNQSGFDHVHILEGGIDRWTGDVSAITTAAKPSDFTLTRQKADIVGKSYVQSQLGKPDVFILDARPAELFNSGSIPGSHNIPFDTYVRGASLKPLESLTKKLADLKVAKDSPIITTCGSGLAASDLLTVLHDLGYSNVKLYDGSWNEWELDPKTPKQQSKG